MQRRQFLAGATAGAVAPGTSRPNILLIVGDNQQWRTVANRSLCQTPHLNRLAAEGVLFNRAYTNAAVCSPARNALLTGAFNWKFGTYNQPDAASALTDDPFPDIVTYAELLRRAGYWLGYNGKWHTSTRRSPLDFGYHEIGAPNRYHGRIAELGRKHNELARRSETARRPMKTIQWAGSPPFGLWGYSEVAEEQTEWQLVSDAAIRMIRSPERRQRPWMVEVHFPESSRGWPLAKYRERYDHRAIPLDDNFRDTFAGKPGLHRREAETYGVMSDEDFRQGRAFYYASFEQMDAQIGRILTALEQSGQTSNTMVVFVADHGAPWGAHHMWIPCFAPYEELYRIPMIIRWPGRVQPGATCDHLVQLHDLAHTFVDIAGAAPLPHAHGTTIAPLLGNPSHSDWRDMILCPWYGQNFPMLYRMVISRRFKYVFNSYDYDECYDLEEDPAELRNIVNSREHAAVVDDMRARTYELMNRFEDPFGEKVGGQSTRFLAQRYLPQGRRSVHD